MRRPSRSRRAHAPGSSQPYIEHLLGYIDCDALKPLKLVVNAGNGGAGIAMDGLKQKLPFEFIEVNYEPDGTFPNGIPNPMLLENQAATADAVQTQSGHGHRLGRRF